MCGITGFLLHSSCKNDRSLSQITANSVKYLSHRGPDGDGVWCNEERNLSLGHSRLSIIDISSAGSQPMHSHCGRYVITFNGEIYNYHDMRSELENGNEGYIGRSDTEVLIECISKWGIQKTLVKIVGMFAFGLWDKEEKLLYIARDRMGEKPLYYGWYNRTFMFASELKAFRAWPGFRPQIDHVALEQYLQNAYVPTPACIFKGFRKLIPGSFCKIDVSNFNSLPAPTRYWSIEDIMGNAGNNVIVCNDIEAIDSLESVMKDAVRNCMVSDVPLGAFLSGGVDSSLIAALMQSESTKAIRTFSIGFEDKKYDESESAAAVANHIGTEHTDLYVTSEDALNIVPQLPHIYDEPFSDSSQIPTFLVSKLTKDYVTVALSGDGADELFGGYNRYVYANTLKSRRSVISYYIRSIIGKVLKEVPPYAWDTIYHYLNGFMPSVYKMRLPGERLHKLARVLENDNVSEIYEMLSSVWSDPRLLSNHEQSTGKRPNDKFIDVFSASKYMMYRDLIQYLPDDILTKVDRAAMAASLEARAPYLNHNVVEFASRLPDKLKIRNNQGKWILRQLLYRYVPKKLVDRPKMGFGIPIDSWLRGPLRDWTKSVLSTENIRKHDYLNPVPIRNALAAHLSGRENRHHEIWSILVFQSWLESWDI